MLRILGRRAPTCDGTSRREVLRVGGLSLFGSMTLPRLLRADTQGSGRPTARARSIIVVNLFGGPSHLDMFDMKPDAPAEVRGEFRPIDTSVTGLHICEHMPLLARWMHKATLIRSVSHTYNSHNPSAVLTGFTGGDDRENYYTKRSDHPGISAVCQYLGIGLARLAPARFICPQRSRIQPGDFAAPVARYGGYLGRQYDPLFADCDPEIPARVQPGSIVLRPRHAVRRAAAAVTRVGTHTNRRPIPAPNFTARRGRSAARRPRTTSRESRHDGPHFQAARPSSC